MKTTIILLILTTSLVLLSGDLQDTKLSGSHIIIRNACPFLNYIENSLESESCELMKLYDEQCFDELEFHDIEFYRISFVHTLGLTLITTYSKKSVNDFRVTSKEVPFRRFSTNYNNNYSTYSRLIKRIDKEQWLRFENILTELDFWDNEQEELIATTDGVYLTIEGFKNGEKHILHHNVPEKFNSLINLIVEHSEVNPLYFKY